MKRAVILTVLVLAGLSIPRRAPADVPPCEPDMDCDIDGGVGVCNGGHQCEGAQTVGC